WRQNVIALANAEYYSLVGTRSTAGGHAPTGRVGARAAATFATNVRPPLPAWCAADLRGITAASNRSAIFRTARHGIPRADRSPVSAGGRRPGPGQPPSVPGFVAPWHCRSRSRRHTPPRSGPAGTVVWGEISLSQGAEWKTLISRYITTIALSGEACCV